jgi:hypothetical protein
MHENMDIETGQYLQSTDHRIPKGRTPNQVTICYLKLPSTHAVLHTMIDYGCGNSGYAAGTSGISMLVELESFGLTPSQKKQFSVCVHEFLEPASVCASFAVAERVWSRPISDQEPGDQFPRSFTQCSEGQDNSRN